MRVGTQRERGIIVTQRGVGCPVGRGGATRVCQSILLKKLVLPMAPPLVPFAAAAAAAAPAADANSTSATVAKLPISIWRSREPSLVP